MISADNKKLLDEIANRLFTNHAAIMIGAGFSKNAISVNPACKKFPDWNELGNIFYDKLYGEEATSPKKEYLNVLKLAEEVEAAFGRPTLNDILQNSIPDLEYEPSNLHIKLLALPWIDVFTTNYDTLLERTAKHVFNRKYTTVVSKDDLVQASKPRIIKLHGSFPSSKPFTITEEDYRIYPKISAPFVNTVQQSLLENTLCLIGFSGDDPNFLKWIGWLRDNLEKGITKIYLVGSFNLSDSQIKLLDKRNIVLVNLANDYHKALNLFVNFLSDKARTNNILRWPYNKESAPFPDKNNIQEGITKTISIWKEERQTYPGWVILPEEKRDAFWLMTKIWLNALNSENKAISEDLQFNFIFELCWRLEKSLSPIDTQTASLIKSLLNDKYDCKERIILAIYLLKSYRQHGKIQDWDKLYQQLDSLESIPPTLREELNYENGLFSLFNFDYPKLKTITEKWTFPASTPFENAKKAGILAEIGQLPKAIEIVEQSLISIREQQATATSSTDCTLLSQESYILDLYQSLVFVNPKSDQTRNKKEEFLDRISNLKLSLCDPIHEYNYFKILLSPVYSPRKEIDIHNDYDIGEATKTHHWSKSYNEQEHAFSFLLFCENTGMPFCIHTEIGKNDFAAKEAKSAISRLSEYNLIWAISVCGRIADEKAADELFSRKSINSLSVDSVNGLCESFVLTLNENENDISIEENHEINFAQVLAKILPEIISRLIPRCNTDVKANVLKLINTILASDFRHKYFNVEKLIKRFVSSLLPNEIELFFPDILKLPIPKNITHLDDRLLAPFEYLKINNDSFNKFKFDKTLISPYYTALTSNYFTIKKWGFITLARLCEFDLLGNVEQQKFADLLWKELDIDGLPFIPDYSKTFFTILPHPQKIDTLKILKREVMIFQWDDFSTSTKFSNSKDSQTINFFTAINHLLFQNSFDKKEIKFLIRRIFLFWNSNKKVLCERTSRDEFKHVFYQMQWCLGKLLKGLSNSYNTEQIHSLLQDLKQHNLSCLYLQCVINKTNSIDSIKKELEVSITSKDINKRKDALWSLEELCFSEDYKKSKVSFFDTLLFSILYEDNVKTSLNIDFLIHFINKRKELAKEFRVQIMNILDHLATITDYANTDSPLSFDEKLIIRQSGMRLAYIMWQNLNSPEKEESVTKWKNLANNENEFSDIRNKWM